MSFKTTEIVNMLTDLPRPSRRDVEKIVKFVYQSGRSDAFEKRGKSIVKKVK